MRITIVIWTENAAFEDAPGSEPARILRALADRYERETAHDFDTKLFDVNGNRVGDVIYTD